MGQYSHMAKSHWYLNIYLHPSITLLLYVYKSSKFTAMKTYFAYGLLKLQSIFFFKKQTLAFQADFTIAFASSKVPSIKSRSLNLSLFSRILKCTVRAEKCAYAFCALGILSWLILDVNLIDQSVLDHVQKSKILMMKNCILLAVQSCDRRFPKAQSSLV